MATPEISSPARPSAARIGVREACALAGCSPPIIRRLVACGFVRGLRLSPRKIHVEAASLHAHLQRVRDDPDWWTPERVRAFQTGVPL